MCNKCQTDTQNTIQQISKVGGAVGMIVGATINGVLDKNNCKCACKDVSKSKWLGNKTCSKCKHKIGY